MKLLDSLDSRSSLFNKVPCHQKLVYDRISHTLTFYRISGRVFERLGSRVICGVSLLVHGTKVEYLES